MQSKDKIIFVKNGPPDRARLLNLFECFGRIEHLDIFRERRYAFITFSDRSSVELAISKLDGKVKYNRTLFHVSCN